MWIMNTLLRLPSLGWAHRGMSAVEGFVLGARDFFEACVLAVSVANEHERLSRLTDAELAQRGLSREALIEDVYSSNRRRDRRPTRSSKLNLSERLL